MTRALPNQSVAKGVEYERVDKGAPVSDLAKQWDGWGTALKPAWEPIVLARKPLIGTVAENVQAHGAGALNIDGCRIATDEAVTAHSRGSNGAFPKRPIETSAEESGRKTDQRKGAYGRDGEASAERRYTDEGSTNFAATPGPRGGSPAGRWPANVIHDGSEEVLAAFPDAPGQQRGVGPANGAKPSINTYGDYGPREQFDPRGDAGSAARFFYTAKADADDRLGSKHPTVKPLDLMQWLVRLVTPPGALVLDPFAGTGTTGEAAFREGMRAILIEREEEYHNDIRRRMTLALAGPDERRREGIKARGHVADAGPLFGGSSGDSLEKNP